MPRQADTHPDHRATFRFVRDAAKAAGYRRPLFTFVVHGKPPAGPAHRVALTEAEQDRKRAILKGYQLRALEHLAAQRGRPATAHDIAEAQGATKRFLLRALKAQVTAGLLRSASGPAPGCPRGRRGRHCRWSMSPVWQGQGNTGRGFFVRHGPAPCYTEAS